MATPQENSLQYSGNCAISAKTEAAGSKDAVRALSWAQASLLNAETYSLLILIGGTKPNQEKIDKTVTALDNGISFCQQLINETIGTNEPENSVTWSQAVALLSSSLALVKGTAAIELVPFATIADAILPD